MKVATLGSGSGGNSVFVEGAGTRILVDAGFSGVQIERRLDELGVEPDSIRAVVVTHEHRDHTSGMGVAARRWGWPLYMSPETRDSTQDLLRGEEEVRVFRGGQTFSVGALSVSPFYTCHDAAAPLAVSVEDPERELKLGVATDLGRATTGVRHALSGSHFLILEANHDELLLRDGPYPWPVKQRIGGSRGHLSNRLAAELAEELLHPGLCGVLLAHLSRECNERDLARRVVGEALEAAGYRGVLEVAEQDRPSRLFRIPRLLQKLRSGPQMDLFAAG